MKKLPIAFVLLVIAIIQTSAQQTIYDVTPGNGNGLRFWSSDLYKIHMGNGTEYNYGPVTNYSIKMNMNETSGRGWTWGQPGLTPIAAISNVGNMQIAGNFISLGNLGIGTITPSTKLEIVGNGPSLSILKLNNSDWQCNQEMAIEFWNGSYLKTVPTSRIVSKMHNCGNGGEDLIFQTQTSSTINPNQTYPTTKMVIANSGNVGIGTSTPDYKLDVLGTIRANEVKVATGWSDFVFEPDYDLPTLQEVESYIDQNGHLPDIPSAEEIKADGISLGEMDAKLLQKIEELTLYQIELLEKLEQQNERLQEQQKRLEKLENKR